jgi:hypothetical protein
MSLPKPTVIIAALVVLGGLAGAFFLGQSALAARKDQSVIRMNAHHVASCGRLGSPEGSAQHAGCLRELGALKVVHDGWTSEDVY